VSCTRFYILTHIGCSYARVQPAVFDGETGDSEDSISQWQCVFEQSEAAYRTKGVHL